MEKLFIGAGFVSLFVRHARSLKDKRQITQSLMQKLKNEGFSATEMGFGDNHKRAMIGFVICSHSVGAAAEQLEKAKRIFIGDFEVVHAKKEILELDTGFELPFLDPEDQD